MSAHTFIEIGQQPILTARESVIPEVIALFTEQEFHAEEGSYGYISNVANLRDRLQLHGFTAKAAKHDLHQALEQLATDEPTLELDGPGAQPLSALHIEEELSNHLNSSDQYSIYEEPYDVLSRMDVRSFLRLALEVASPNNVPVRYELSDLIEWEMLTPGDPICDQTRMARQRNLSRDAPLVVLTEGSSDSRLLAEGLKITHPHLTEYLKFMDFGEGAEGSASSLAKLVRSFMGAGIANRVVAIADNDTAAHDALKKLKQEHLPESYRILHYPEIPLLKNYPTIGPQSASPVSMDVNGKAGSLEMYFGEDILRANGSLVPIQWTAYIEGQGSYQGTVVSAEKRRLQKSFQAKVRAATEDPGIRGTQDWSAIDAIITVILNAFE